MPLTRALVEQAISLAEQAGMRNDSIFKGDYVEDCIVKYAGEAIAISFNGSGDIKMGANPRIDPAWLTPFFTITIDQGIQEDGACYLKALCPMPMRINSRVDGFRFFGIKKLFNNWTKYESIGKASSGIKMGGINQFTPGYVYDGTYVYIFGNYDIKQIDVQLVANDPRDIPTWNKQTMDYPINEALVPLMLQLLFRKEFGIQVSSPQKVLNNENANT